MRIVTSIHMTGLNIIYNIKYSTKIIYKQEVQPYTQYYMTND
jgi:hypothetical protein